MNRHLNSGFFAPLAVLLLLVFSSCLQSELANQEAQLEKMLPSKEPESDDPPGFDEEAPPRDRDEHDWEYEQTWVQETLNYIARLEKHPSTLILDGNELERIAWSRDTIHGTHRIQKGKGLYLDIPASELHRHTGDRHVMQAGKINGLIIRNCVFEAEFIEEALKFSAAQDVVIQNCTLKGGNEDALDIVRGRRYVFQNVHFVARGAQAITIKANVHDVRFLGCRFSGESEHSSFVELGNWSDYDVVEWPKMTGIKFDSNNIFEYNESTQAAVRTWNAEKPTIHPKETVAVISDDILNFWFSEQRKRHRDKLIERIGWQELRWEGTPHSFEESYR